MHGFVFLLSCKLRCDCSVNLQLIDFLWNVSEAYQVDVVTTGISLEHGGPCHKL